MASVCSRDSEVRAISEASHLVRTVRAARQSLFPWITRLRCALARARKPPTWPGEGAWVFGLGPVPRRCRQCDQLHQTGRGLVSLIQLHPCGFHVLADLLAGLGLLALLPFLFQRPREPVVL